MEVSRCRAAASLGRAFHTTFSGFRADACIGDWPRCDSIHLPGAVSYRPTENGARSCQGAKALDAERLVAQTLTLV